MERLDHFMARANSAYYAGHNPYGDFTTAPEISQVFGELLGLWAAITWQSLGRPTPVILAEAGPGRGTMMTDALRAVTVAAPDFAAALKLHLIETSPALRARQRSQLPQATWHDRLDDLPQGPILLLANEFLDALPIRQFIRREDGWTERWVEDGRFVELPTRYRAARMAEVAQPGAVIEVCEPGLELAENLARRICADSGAALFLDYGPAESATGDSLQALRAGQPADPLAEPGHADLSAHVDFAAFAAAARKAGAAVIGPVPQGLFLARLGLFERTDRLARGRPVKQVASLIAAAQRLAEPNRMGRLFKALAVCHSPALVPAGFES